MGKEKQAGRLGKRYRVMWDQNVGQEGYYNPPLSPDRAAQSHHGFFEGRPVDAYVCSPGWSTGYTVDWPTKVPNAEFIVDRLSAGAKIGSVGLWRKAENTRRLWEQGIDPIGLQVEESRRLGIDHWFRLSMNDWHHQAGTWTEEKVGGVNIGASDFYSKRPELLIGEEGARGWPKSLANILRWLQDWNHEEVRALRMGIAVEAMERYDADGFVYDFMRVPGYFKHGEEESGAEIMTGFIRQTRAAFDDIGKEKDRALGLAVRVPNTIAGAKRLGLDVSQWVEQGLVDMVIPSSFFAQDTEENVAEWVRLAEGTPVQIQPCIDEAYLAGHTGELRRWYLKPPMMTPLSVEMTRAIAARHLSKGVDGLYLFNYFGTAMTYDYDNLEVVDDIGDPQRLKHKDKCYMVTRSGEQDNDSFPNCLKARHQIPCPVSADLRTISMEVADDLSAAPGRTRNVQLWLHLDNISIEDQVEVSFNGATLECENPMEVNGYDPTDDKWFSYDLRDALPVQGDNQIGIRLLAGNERLAQDGLFVEIQDVELWIEYEYPNGRWITPRGYAPRT